MTNKTSKCYYCNIRPINFKTQGRDSTMCEPCFDYAGWENTHNDESHDRVGIAPEQIEECPVCNPELDPRNDKRQRKQSSKTGKKNFSHKNCGHPLTKVERAKCRAGKTIAKIEENLDEARKSLDALPREITPEEIVDLELSDTCPKCGAEGDEPCRTQTGGRVRSNKGRHSQRDAS